MQQMMMQVLVMDQVIGPSCASRKGLAGV